MISLICDKYKAATHRKTSKQPEYKQTNKMVKTRQQQAKQEKQEQRSKNYETSVGVGVQTRSGTSKLERVELPTVVLSKEMNKRFQIKKAIAKNSRETVMERKLKKLFKYQRQYKEHRKQNNDEMLALWKNFNTAFTMIEGLYKFKDRVEDR